MPKSSPHSVQGFKIYPIHHADEYTARPGAWYDMIVEQSPWRFDLDLVVKNAARNRLYHSHDQYTPAIGDILFFGRGGHWLVVHGQAIRTGVTGTAHFTHIGIIVDIDANGTVLIAEAGGAGIKYMRQSTIRDLKAGQIFRPENREYAYRIAQMALDATKFDYHAHLEGLASLDERNRNATSFQLANADNIEDDNAACFQEEFPTDISWKRDGKLNPDYHICASAPYATGGMLLSPASSRENKNLARVPLITPDEAPCLHNPGFRKETDVGPSSFNPWCSRFAMMVIAGAYVELACKQNGEDLKKCYISKQADRMISSVFAKTSGRESSAHLRYIAPKTLYEVLLKASDDDRHLLFKRIGSWMNFDDCDPKTNERKAHFRYNGGMAGYSGRPFLNNDFKITYDGKLETHPEICNDGVTTAGSPAPRNTSADFQTLQTFALNRVVSLLTQLSPLAKSNPDLQNATRAMSKLHNSLSKAEDDEDLILMIAGFAREYGNLFPSGLVKETADFKTTFPTNMDHPDNFLEKLLGSLIEQKQALQYKTHPERQYVDRLLQTLSHVTFWASRTRVARLPDGISGMRQFFQSLGGLVEEVGLGTMDFSSGQLIVPRLKEIALERLRVRRSRDPFTLEFYTAVSQFDLSNEESCRRLMHCCNSILHITEEKQMPSVNREGVDLKYSASVESSGLSPVSAASAAASFFAATGEPPKLVSVSGRLSPASGSIGSDPLAAAAAPASPASLASSPSESIGSSRLSPTSPVPANQASRSSSPSSVTSDMSNQPVSSSQFTQFGERSSPRGKIDATANASSNDASSAVLPAAKAESKKLVND
jgi:hypothetical protein